MDYSSKALTFNVATKKPELIAPAKPTPHEVKLLSDIDDQDGLRFQTPVIQFYRSNPSKEGKKDPVKVIRDAVAKALVFYYPLAGRLREGAARKLMVDCTGEGVVFIEADADVALHHLGDAFYPPFPYLDKLLLPLPTTAGLTHSPLLLIQVTRLTCGGFVVAMRVNHTMSDADGIVLFLSAVGELARGAETPLIQPVWERQLLSARSPPRVTCTHHEYGDSSAGSLVPSHNMVERSFLFSAADISALRSRLPPHLGHFTTFEIVAGCIWRCRAISLSLHPDEEIRFSCIVNCRRRFDPPLPEGYYGNAIVYPSAVTTAGRLSGNPFHYAVELVRSAKGEATEEYVKSVADLMVTSGRPVFRGPGTYIVSDLRWAGFGEVDFGWGAAAYGGVAQCGIDLAPGVVSYALPYYKDRKGMVMTISLPPNAMDTFIIELHKLLGSKTPYVTNHHQPNSLHRHFATINIEN